MELDLEKAEKLRDALNKHLQTREMQSFAKLHPSSTKDGLYDVRIVLHPEEDSLQKRIPNVEFSPWGGPPTGEQYIKRTPRTPSKRNAPFDDWYPGVARRRHETSTHSPDVNPNYPGLRRVPDIQDLVRRVAMKPALSERLSRVSRVLKISNRLSKFARVGHGFHKESEFLIEELVAHLKSEGHSGRTKVVRVVNDIKKSMKSDGYSFEKKK